MKTRKLLGQSKLALATAIAALTAGQSFAQGGDLFVEEILVTARKQTESLQDIPLSLTAIDSDEISLQAIETTEDVIKLTPGLTFDKGIGGQDLRPDIRGITSLSGRSNIAILIDGVDMTSDAMVGGGAGQLVGLGLYDLERVEVVRGPQSALFGRNAFGGAINYITRKPSVDFEGSVSAELGNYDTVKLRAGFSGPISDTLLYRFNIAHSEKDGQYKDDTSGKVLGGEETDSISATLQFLPTDDLEIIARLDWADQDNDQQATATAQANGCIVADQASTKVVMPNTTCSTNPALKEKPYFLGTVDDLPGSAIMGASDNDYEGSDNELTMLTVLLNYEMDDYTFTSNTAFTKAEGTDNYDFDHLDTVTSVIGSAFQWVDSSNPFNFQSDIDFERDVFFQDFRLSFDAGDDLRWLVGAEYYEEDYSNENYDRANDAITRAPATLFIINSLSPSFVPGFGFVSSELPIKQDRETTAYGVYGGIDWMFVEDWEISLSARWQYEEYEGAIDSILATNQVPSRPTTAQFWTQAEIDALGPNIPFEDDFSSFNPRLVLTHYLNDNVMLYGSVAKGSKPGGFSADISLNPVNLTYDLEELLSYEFGWKTSWLDDRIIVNGAIYYLENEDKQVNNIDYSSRGGTPRTFVDNIGETSSEGLELQVAAVISEGWTASVNYTYMETEIKEYLNTSAAGVEAPSPSFVPPPTNNCSPYPCTAEQLQAFALADPDADQSGNELPRVPKHMLSLSSNYEWALTDAVDAFVRVDGRYQSERWVSVNNLVEIDSSFIWDLKFGVRNETYEAVAYIDNVADDDTISSAINLPNFTNNFANMLVMYPAKKRTAGIRVKYNF